MTFLWIQLDCSDPNETIYSTLIISINLIFFWNMYFDILACNNFPQPRPPTILIIYILLQEIYSNQSILPIYRKILSHVQYHKYELVWQKICYFLLDSHSIIVVIILISILFSLVLICCKHRCMRWYLVIFSARRKAASMLKLKSWAVMVYAAIVTYITKQPQPRRNTNNT